MCKIVQPRSRLHVLYSSEMIYFSTIELRFISMPYIDHLEFLLEQFVLRNFHREKKNQSRPTATVHVIK